MEKASHTTVLEHIDAIARGREDALVVIGEIGVGKSHLLRKAYEASPIRAELVRAHLGESAIPLAGFWAVFDAIRAEHSAHFARQFHLRSEEQGGLFAAAHDLLDLIVGFNLPPTLILIDRIDAMDELTQSLIGIIGGRLTGTNLRIAASARQIDPQSPLADLPTVKLAPLRLEELVEHAKPHFPESDIHTLRIIAGYAGGNPGIMLEQLGALHPEQLDGSAWLTLPPRISESLTQVTGWPEAFPDDSRHLLELSAVAPMCHADALANLRPQSVDLLEDLIDANLLQQRGSHVSFVDQRLRSHVYWSQRAHVRSQHHLELAAAVEAYDPMLACWHRSFIAMDEEVVAELLNAAIVLVGRQRVSEAIEFAERALRRTTVPENHAAAKARLCSQLFRVGEISLVARYSDYSDTHQSDSHVILALAAMKLTAQLFDRQVMRDEEAQALVALHAEGELDRASDLLTLTALYRAERWELHEARIAIEQARSLVKEATDLTRLKVRTMLEIVEALEGNGVQDGDPEVPDREPLGDLPPELLLMRGRAFTYREQYAEARRMFHHVLHHPTDRDHIWSDLAMYASIGNEMAAGQFQLARQAIVSWATGSPWINRGTAANTLIDAWHHYSTGDLDQSLQLIDTVLDLASKESSLGLRCRAYALRGSIDLLNRDPEHAVMNLRNVNVISRRLANPTLPRHWADYVEACMLTNRTKEAGAAVATLEGRLAASPSRWGALALGRCRAIAEPGSKSIALFGDAVQLFHRGEQPYELGRTLASLADKQVLLGMESEARHSRIAAVTAFELSGAGAWAERVRLPADDEQPAEEMSLLDHLGADERAVVLCLLQGMRNREIAESLHISIRTVELRLTRTYRALGVRSRGELSALFHGQGQQE